MNMKSWVPEIQHPKYHTYVYVSSGIIAQNTPALVYGRDCAMALDVTSHPSTTAEWAQAVCAAEGKRPVRYQFFTHAHGDHYKGAAGLSGALVICTQGVAQRLAELRKRDPAPLVYSRTGVQGGDRAPVPDIIFEGSAWFDLGDCHVQLLDMGHCHTPSDSIGFVPEDGIVQCGDLFYNYVMPDGNQCRVDLWIAALDRILKLDADTYIPGHGPVGDRTELIACKECLQLIWDKAGEALKRGISQKQGALELDLGPYEPWLEPGRRVSLFDVSYRVQAGEDPILDLPDWDLNETADQVRARFGLPQTSFYIPTKDYPFFRQMDDSFDQ